LSTRIRRLGTAAIAAGLSITAAGVPALLAPSVSQASSHREAPGTAKNPEIDATDLYAFVSPDDATSVTLIANYYPNQDAAGGPNFFRFDDDALYDINIDNNGDAVPDVIYRFDFNDHYRNLNTFLYNTGQVKNLTDLTLNFYQTYDLEMRRRTSATHRCRRTRRCVSRPPRPSRTVAAASSSGRPTTRSSSTCGCSTSSTAPTSRRSATTP